jgi:putative nucleotidyltransferase-like protein
LSAALPSLNVVAAALRKTTEHLAHELTRPSESPPDWTEFEWAVARSVAAMQGISFLLATRLRWRGPSAWQSFLDQQREHSLLRDDLIGRLLQRLDAATRDSQIACLAMKGAALRALHVYAPGERPMGDVDLLVRNADLEATAAMMKSLGYLETRVPGREIIYEPPGRSVVKSVSEHVGNPLKVEVHTSVAEPLPVRKIDITAYLWPSDARPGLNTYPNLAALLMHCLLRAASNMRAHALRQIQLHDIAALSRRLVERDWEALLQGSSSRARWWMYPPFALTARYHALAAPPSVLLELRGACPPWLRNASDRQELTDVSWSNLRIAALPGMAWAKTPAEAVRYVRSRALPDGKALAGIAVAVEQQPHLKELPWYQLSHSRRILRWLLSRPPRVQTITSVIAALSDARRDVGA